MELARYDLKQKQIQNWININSNQPEHSKHSSQSELYEEEKKSMFTTVNNFMTELIIDKDRLKDSSKYRIRKIVIFKINTINKIILQ